MKRLHVLPVSRGKSISRDPTTAVIREAGKMSHPCKCLPTVPFMKEAIALYLSLGFGLKFTGPTLA